MMNINEVSILMGISIRTLHYYDEIGLLKPESIIGYVLIDYQKLSEEELPSFRQHLFSCENGGRAFEA